MRSRISIRVSVLPSIGPTTTFFSISRIWEKMVWNYRETVNKNQIWTQPFTLSFPPPQSTRLVWISSELCQNDQFRRIVVRHVRTNLFCLFKTTTKMCLTRYLFATEHKRSAASLVFDIDRTICLSCLNPSMLSHGGFLPIHSSALGQKRLMKITDLGCTKSDSSEECKISGKGGWPLRRPSGLGRTEAVFGATEELRLWSA